MNARTLHLGNIANVAYGYARTLRQAGRAADVVCYDLTHVLSLPEWIEGDFSIRVADEWAPPLDHPEVRRIKTPLWYSRIRSSDYYRTGAVKNAARGLNDDASGSAHARLITNAWIDVLIRESRRHGPRWTLTAADIQAYTPLVDALSGHFFHRYDAIFGYANSAVPPLLAGIEPYVPVEIGTMRDTVEQDTPLGRLLALAYRTAPMTIVTNADCIAAARTLGLERVTYVPHPVDEDVFRPYPPDERLAMKQALCETPYLLIAPARQTWSVKANDRYLRAFAALVRDAEVDATLLIAEWGPDVPRARRLIEELGIARRVRWFDPAPAGRMARLFNAADLVLDQFHGFGTFGLIGPQALACGTPCLLSFETRHHEWCFSAPPPFIAAESEREIFDALRYWLTHDAERLARGRESRHWIERHHSKSVVAAKFDAIGEHLTAERLAGGDFERLRREKLALPATAKGTPSASRDVSVGGRPQMLKTPFAIAASGARLLTRVSARAARIPGRLARMGGEIGGSVHSGVRGSLETLRRTPGAAGAAVSASRQRPDRLADVQRTLHAEILSAFDLMGKNRVEDRQLLTETRTRLLETLVRSRVATPWPPEQPAGLDERAPTHDAPISMDEARRQLQAAAPLNYALFERALATGTASYETLPPDSCSTSRHPQADLFRAFLRSYLHGYVLDIGCGPQPVPRYLAGYPVHLTRGIDPISRQEDHPFEFVSGFGELLPWHDAMFDVVVSGSTLDHFYLLDRGLAGVFRVLRPGGRFVTWITEFDGAPRYDPYAAAMAAPFDDEHLFHVDRKWLLPMMTEIGFDVLEVVHFELPFNYLFMTFEKPVHA